MAVCCAFGEKEMLSSLLAERVVVANVGINNIAYTGPDLCALVLNGLIIVNFSINKKIRNRTSRLFLALAICSLCASIFNLLGVLQAVIPALYANEPLCRAFQIMFYISYNMAGIMFYVYSVSLISSGGAIKTVWRIFAYALCVLAAMGNILAVLEFYAHVNISKLLFEGFIYGGQELATLFGMAAVLLYRKKLRPVQRINVYAFVLLNLAANVVQILVSAGAVKMHVQISAFALAMAVLLIYVTLQRPEDEVDAVSGMFNMQAYVYRTTERLSSNKPFVAFVCELGNLAIINTTFGIRGGNEAIKIVAERIRAVLPKNYLLYRLGGARFAVNFDTEKDFRDFEPQFFAAVGEPVEVCGTKVRISVTACIIPMPSVADKVSDVEDIMKYYRAGAKLSDSVFVATKEAVKLSHRREHVEYAIQRALKNRSFKVFYQPIYSVNDKRINSCEALIRLNDPTLGFIGPDEFIPIAEQSGRIVEVGKFVMEEVCRFIKEKNPMQYGLEFIDVNLSVIQCMHPEIIADIISVLEKYGVERRLVNLEVTETASAQSYAVLQSHLNELHDNGFTISLDDFGTGFSSVEYLIKFPFDVVKLDKSLVWAYMDTKKYEPILKHYMPMLHGLGTKIVAEGIETIEMVNALEELGCDYLQGYYFSRPIPEDDFIAYLKEKSETKDIV